MTYAIYNMSMDALQLFLVKSSTSLVGSYSHREGIIFLHFTQREEIMSNNHSLFLWDLDTSGTHYTNIIPWSAMCKSLLRKPSTCASSTTSAKHEGCLRLE